MHKTSGKQCHIHTPGMHLGNTKPSKQQWAHDLGHMQQAQRSRDTVSVTIPTQRLADNTGHRPGDTRPGTPCWVCKSRHYTGHMAHMLGIGREHTGTHTGHRRWLHNTGKTKPDTQSLIHKSAYNTKYTALSTQSQRHTVRQTMAVICARHSAGTRARHRCQKNVST